MTEATQNGQNITEVLSGLLLELLNADSQAQVIADTLLMKAEFLLPGLDKDDYVTVVRTIIDTYDTRWHYMR